MKYTSTTAGYDMRKCEGGDPWWQYPCFPLVPQIVWRGGDEWNANYWFFSWMWFRAWSLEHFAFEFAAEIERTGLNVKAIVGWVRIVVRVLPLPHEWLDGLQRKPANPSKTRPIQRNANPTCDFAAKEKSDDRE